MTAEKCQLSSSLTSAYVTAVRCICKVVVICTLCMVIGFYMRYVQLEVQLLHYDYDCVVLSCLVLPR